MRRMTHHSVVEDMRRVTHHSVVEDMRRVTHRSVVLHMLYQGNISARFSRNVSPVTDSTV